MKRQRTAGQLTHQARPPGHERRIRNSLRQAIRPRTYPAAPPPPHPSKPCTRRQSLSIHPPFHLKPRRSASARQRRRSRCAGSDGYSACPPRHAATRSGVKTTARSRGKLQRTNQQTVSKGLTRSDPAAIWNSRDVLQLARSHLRNGLEHSPRAVHGSIGVANFWARRQPSTA